MAETAAQTYDIIIMWTQSTHSLPFRCYCLPRKNFSLSVYRARCEPTLKRSLLLHVVSFGLELEQPLNKRNTLPYKNFKQFYAAQGGHHLFSDFKNRVFFPLSTMLMHMHCKLWSRAYFVDDQFENQATKIHNRVFHFLRFLKFKIPGVLSDGVLSWN